MKIHEIVRNAETNLKSGTDRIGEHVEWSMNDTINTIYAYLNSKHISGKTDSLEREKPFFNIVTAAVNIWYRATDLDRKDITILPDKYSNTASAFIATVLLQEWMKRTKFASFLNAWGRTLSQYGSAVIKSVEKDGELVCQVVPWSRLIVDPIDFYALPRIEKFYKTPAQLKNMATPGHHDYAHYDLEIVNSIIDKRTTRRDLKGQQKDNRSEFIEVYEVHGELSQASYKEAKGEDTDEKDEDIYFQQVQVITWLNEGGEDKDFVLYSGKEKKDPYLLTHLIEEEGRTMAIGAVESLFDSQWMVNHSMKSWKDQMDLASKLVFQTADRNVAGKNVLTNIENGDIILTDQNSPITAFPNFSHDLTTIQKFGEQWRVLGQEVTSTPDASRGITPPSGTALGTVQITTAQGLSLFEIMVENKANHLEELLRQFIIPHLKSKLNNQDEIAAVLEDRGISQIDRMYVPKEAVRRYRQKLKQALLQGGEIEPFNQPEAESEVQNQLSDLGNIRYLSPGDVTWKDVVKDLEWKLDIDISGELINKQAVYQTLTTVLQSVASNPMILTDPNAKLIFNKILSLTGSVSPIELSAPSAQPAQSAQPVASPEPANPQALSALSTNK